MAVILSASDETFRGTFCYGGLAAPVNFWEGIFAKRWDERVLAGPPRIEYLHMTEIRSPKWRMENGISDGDAERRVEQAVRTICKWKHPSLFSFKFNGELFNQIVKRRVKRSDGVLVNMLPDHLGFIGYAFVVLHNVQKAIPDAEKVDFLVEANGEITKNFNEFYKGIPEFLESIERPDLLKLVGDIIPGGKERSPLQAADVFCWHDRRGSEGSLDGHDLSRWKHLLQKPKQYCLGSIKDDVLREIAEASNKKQFGDGVKNDESRICEV